MIFITKKLLLSETKSLKKRTIIHILPDFCINKKYKNYGAKGVTVAPEWHDFNIFERDVINIPGWVNKFNDPVNYNLDKDFHGQKFASMKSDAYEDYL